MNSQSKPNGIEWCDATLNPVVGCPRGCQYCYAKEAYELEHGKGTFSTLVFHPERLEDLKRKKPTVFFMDSMTDIEFWKPEWLAEVIEAMNANLQHRYIFLTKMMTMTSSSRLSLLTKQNADIWVGATTEGQDQFDFRMSHYVKFVSVEPMLGPICLVLSRRPGIIQLVIVGSETFHHRPVNLPKREWVESLVGQCRQAGVPIFMKESLRGLMGAGFVQDRLPWKIDSPIEMQKPVETKMYQPKLF